MTWVDREPKDSETWQSVRAKAAAEAHPVPQPVLARLTAAMEVEMVTKQLSAGELDLLIGELLSGLDAAV